MQFKEINQDLFMTKEATAFVHCISADFALGARIALKFNELGVSQQLERLYDKGQWVGSGYLLPVYIGRGFPVFNLVTKERYWDKPTYETLRQSLEALQNHIQTHYANMILAMPRIGCGLDRLDWHKVKAIIKDVFKNTDVKIVVCYR